MTFWFIFYDKISTFASGELGSAGLLGIKMIEAWLTRKDLAVFGKF
ncbi:MAG: hypothetical protein UW01_C0004G0047 [Candidatus Nomurabacteria bacterium GW2011_GWA2_43_66]|uniref:Uncharacterized protein n=1 Tax=Candidatus Nomurabacteria bacterium GW2011_GWF2_43_24 TaxID=1618778 RepID=A0A0G1EP45_9BACT|nr:MAG: hypothetical protein UV13_C0007G0047 [Parcubacteria group bacterium GW2011_GWC1_42_21]KKS58769.1 MAG: hypothetical protein UV23_C0001G0036 [Candidatus Nomurabacteria bacterium GW2011_GWF1_42_40]KKT00093.1 MAG: hypothetical protein UV77_C0007G0047 [Candidatus Nomurabacteria bacterium GW2011_GWA1_43_17]KKT08028.1 MAG: hypothetical protein UV85_C0002G0047 [Candidatus Nomurabacteria bacterium GW2011_GWB1_43_19]KKT11578.1 MAG: hypothetical protein UV91_C0004G0047 [Candidatus Nomurabacteria b